MTRRASLVLLFTFGLLFAGCSDDESGDDNDTIDMSGDASDMGDDADATQTCNSNAECTMADQICDTATSTCVDSCLIAACDTGLVCDQETGLCIEGEGCTTADDCTTDGDICNACRGVCEPGEGKDICETDVNCFSTEYCDRCRGVCETKAPLCGACTFNEECGDADDRCVDIPSAGGRFCAQACETVNDCPADYECATNGEASQCIPASGDCSAPAECEMSDDCAEVNEVCRMGRCVPGCTPGGCPNNNVCERGECLPPCDMRGEACPMPAMCNPATGLCEIEGACLASRDCPDPETYCDVTQNMCVSGCEVDNDCRDATKECVDNACVPRGCKGAYSCAFGQVCDVASGQCMDAQGPYCDMCDPDAMGSCGPEANKCLSLQDDMGNDVGSFCFVACSTDPDNECPQGYSCTELQDQDGNPAGRVCFRDCTFDPFE